MSDVSPRDRFLEGPVPPRPPGPRGPSGPRPATAGASRIAPHMLGYGVVAMVSALFGLVLATVLTQRADRLTSSLTPNVVFVGTPVLPDELTPEAVEHPDDEADTDFEKDLRACRLAIAAALAGRCDEARRDLKSCRGYMRNTAVANVNNCGRRPAK